MNCSMILIKSFPVSWIKNEAKANNETTMINGNIVLKDFPTAGGTLSPKLTCNFLERVRRMYSSVANNPVMMAAKTPFEPIFP